jgi:hypothetical protein
VLPRERRVGSKRDLHRLRPMAGPINTRESCFAICVANKFLI